MRILKAMLVMFLASMVLRSSAAQTPALKPWSAATYHGLTVGTSTRADVLKLLGKPNYVGREEDTGVPIMTYLVADPVPGTLVVYIKKGILDGMRLDLNKTLTKDDIIRFFGTHYVVVHYATDECIDTGGASPVYESPPAQSSKWSTAIVASQHFSRTMMTVRLMQSDLPTSRSAPPILDAQDVAMFFRS
jgi:hypothetical protein